MKNLYLIIFGMFLINAKALPLDTILVKSEIKNVTVYPFGAQIKRSSQLDLPTGKRILKFENLPFEITEDNLNIESSNFEIIGSIKLEHIQGRQLGKSEKVKAFEKEISDKITLSKNIRDEALILDQHNKILLNHSAGNNENKLVSLAELEKATTYYNREFKKIIRKKQGLKQNLKTLLKEVDSIQDLIQNEVQLNIKNSATAYVFINVETPLQTEIFLGYYLKSAGWTPKYNFKIKDVDSPMDLDLRAEVFQTTGEDWQNAEIILSAKEPSLSKKQPTYTPFIFEKGEKSIKPKEKTFGKLTGVIGNSTDGDILSHSQIDILKNGSIIKTIQSSSQGLFNIYPLKTGVYDLKVSHYGFKKVIRKVTINKKSTTKLEIGLKRGGTELVTETAITEKAVRCVSGLMTRAAGIAQFDHGGSLTARGGRSGQTVYFVDGVKVVGAPNLNNSMMDNSYKEKVITDDIKNMIAHRTYKINPDFDIKSNGESYNIKIKSIKVRADYKYYIMPQYQPFAYVQSIIPNWQQYNLISGDASIYFENKLVGKTYLNTDIVQDTLKLELGKDEQIIVERKGETLNDNSIFMSGGKSKLEKKYTTIVKSNKSKAVQITLIDQYPITENKEISIALLESGGSQINPKNGKLTWDINLKPKNKQEFSFSYVVKYPEYIKKYFNF